MAPSPRIPGPLLLPPLSSLTVMAGGDNLIRAETGAWSQGQNVVDHTVGLTERTGLLLADAAVASDSSSRFRSHLATAR